MVAVAVQPIREAGQRERPEVGEQHRQVDEAHDAADDDGAQAEQREDAERKRHHLHLEEVGLHDRLHPDVVVQRVDLGQVLAAVAGHDLVRVHVEGQPLGVLRRHQADAPQRQRRPGEQHDDRRQQEAPPGETHRAVQDAMHGR